MAKLYVDIETCPNEGYFWRCGYRETITPDQISRERNIITIQYSWDYEQTVHVLVWDYKKWENRDERILRKFAKVYSEADEIVTQNGESFDIPWIRGRLAILKLPTLPKIKSYDTKKVNSKYFYFNSNRLDYLNKVMGGKGKNKMEFSDWVKVIHGDEKALAKMIRYGKKDIRDLKKLERDTRKYLPELVGHRIIKNGKCPKCSHKCIKRGFYRTLCGKRQRYQCIYKKCPKAGTWYHDSRIIYDD